MARVSPEKKRERERETLFGRLVVASLKRWAGGWRLASRPEVNEWELLAARSAVIPVKIFGKVPV